MAHLNRTLSSAALMAVLVLAGCAKNLVREPQVNLTNVRVGGIGLRGGQLLAEIEIKNPNSFSVETNSVSYDLKVSDRDSSGKENWVDFAKGTYEPNIKIRDGGTTKIEVPIEFTYANISGAIRSIMDRGTFNYRVEGTVALREPLRREIPYKHTGNVSLQGVR